MMLQGIGNPGDQASAADRNDDRPDVRQIFQQFQGYGSLARDHLQVVKTVYKGGAFFFLQFNSMVKSLIITAGGQDYFRSVALGGHNLGNRSAGRHNNSAGQSGSRGGVGHTLGMVSGGSRDHAVQTLCVVKAHHFVISPPDFKGACFLHVFELQINSGAAHPAEAGGIIQRGVICHSIQTSGGLFYFFHSQPGLSHK
ncbi:MAG: hypothetical protein BWY65_01645 [Firmicutes bacterium ADurb.Bin373]|nr:MAG: hypothetical protein BWY65_01645 [Firmicutes bacterium ADurb.Bin373]